MIWYKRNVRLLHRLASTGDNTLYTLPWRAFTADLVLWFLIGVGIALFYILHLGAPLFTGLKILLGSSAFGLLGGMLCFLSMESRLIEYLKSVNGGASVTPGKLFSVSKKIFFFMITVLGSMTTAILLMVFMDINYLISQNATPDSEIYFGVFKEVLFAFAVLIFLSVSILGLFSRNLKAVIEQQLRVMEEITRGNYQIRSPVVSNDEFGLIAAKTNDMISGLKERDFCQMSFGKYVAPEVSEMILDGKVPLEGELREVTILFCDLRGYTTFVEGRDPKEVVRFLNDYFTEMEGTVKKHNGIVLQYIGDEIEAVFGAPLDLPEHPQKAVMAAVDMRERLKGLNRIREDEGKDPIFHGIGIHTGTVLAGSVGSPERLTYAMVGDTVNSASRIQDLNKTYHTDILISETTAEALRKKDIPVSSLGKAALRGKRKEIEIFKVH
ncbi:MAG: adenylate/guanylate cyclase domain-containing protein [Deltaproteobacteria bacterium]|nr:adenylate/guanylate cyclase domain-containing protein [Deltaproteobacteria bacterium]